jgi:hypothetical protein
MKYIIHDYEIDKKSEVEAPGIVEAMLEYLPWPSLQLSINYQPSHGTAKVIDQQTDFMYDIETL